MRPSTVTKTHITAFTKDKMSPETLKFQKYIRYCESASKADMPEPAEVAEHGHGKGGEGGSAADSNPYWETWLLRQPR